MNPFYSFKSTVIVQFLICALLPLVLISLFLISSFRSIQIDEQVIKHQALANSTMQVAEFELQQINQSLLQISRDTNVALAGKSGLFGYSAANALGEFVHAFDIVSASVLVDYTGSLAEAAPQDLLILDSQKLTEFGLLAESLSFDEVKTLFIDDAQLTKNVYELSRPAALHGEFENGVLVIQIPLYLSETETLDSRSTYTGKILAFILIDDLINLIDKSNTSLSLEKLTIASTSFINRSHLNIDNALLIEASMSVPSGTISIDANFNVSVDEALAAVDQLTTEYIYYALGIMLLVLTIGWVFIRLELRPLNTLNKIVEQYRQGNFKTHAFQFPFKEFKSVAKLLDAMAKDIHNQQTVLETNVAERTKDLETALLEVRKINRELIRTQNQLVESEKMSQIGVLVAGVAHEVNTPIGVCVTATSILEDRLNSLIGAYEENKLSRAVMTDFITNAQNCIEILNKNTERAAELIHSFKSISVDQSSEHERIIHVRDYLRLILRSLESEIQRKRVDVELLGDLDIKVETYPGALSQIVSNLIINSLKHAFVESHQNSRKIKIMVSVIDDSTVNLLFKDNGVGVEQQNLSKLFEPFYTTGRQKGGSGLGLSIVYNLATQKLNGKIDCTCEPGNGLEISISFPATVLPETVN